MQLQLQDLKPWSPDISYDFPVVCQRKCSSQAIWEYKPARNTPINSQKDSKKMQKKKREEQ